MIRVWVGLFSESVYTGDKLQLRKRLIMAFWNVNNASTLDAMSLILSGNVSTFIIMGGLMSTSAWSAFLNIYSEITCVCIKMRLQKT